jgi:hypothetical protein
MDVIDIRLGKLDWIGLAQDRYRWRALVKLGNESSGSIKCGGTIESGGLSSSPQLHGVG